MRDVGLLGLAFGPLVAFWVLLHRQSRRPGWGFVGYPPSPYVVSLRKLAKAFNEFCVIIGKGIMPALREVSAAMDSWGKSLQ